MFAEKIRKSLKEFKILKRVSGPVRCFGSIFKLVGNGRFC